MGEKGKKKTAPKIRQGFLSFFSNPAKRDYLASKKDGPRGFFWGRFGGN